MKQKYVLLLRGINVGGNRKILMKDLKLLLEKNKYDSVKTYIQSGNILISTTKTPDKIKNEIEKIIQDTYSFEVKTIVIAIDTWRGLEQKLPFELIELNKTFIAFLDNFPTKDSLEKLKEIEFKTEEWQLVEDMIFYKTPEGVGKSKLNNSLLEKKLKVNATSRNWKTILKLNELSLD